MEALRRILEADPRIVYALLFGSRARHASHAGSDVDLAIGLRPDVRFTSREIGALVSLLEEAAGRPIDLVVLNEAAAAVSYRVFRDGIVLVNRDPRLLAAHKAAAVLEYLDFKPTEDLVTRGALAAARRGR
jgi:predicted nucleotidyltransferase